MSQSEVVELLYHDILLTMPRDLINIIVSYMIFLPIKLVEKIVGEKKLFYLDIMWSPQKTLVFHHFGIDTFVAGKLVDSYHCELNRVFDAGDVWFGTKHKELVVIPVLVASGDIQKPCEFKSELSGYIMELCGYLVIIHESQGIINFVKYKNNEINIVDTVDVGSSIYHIQKLIKQTYAIITDSGINVYSRTCDINVLTQTIDYGCNSDLIQYIGLSAAGNMAYIRQVDYFTDRLREYACPAENIRCYGDRLKAPPAIKLENTNTIYAAVNDGHILWYKMPANYADPKVIIALDHRHLIIDAAYIFDTFTATKYDLTGYDDWVYHTPKKHGDYLVIGNRIYTYTLV